MATGLIELNDAGIIQAIDGNILPASIGYALLDGDTLMVGEDARKNARLLPRWTNNRFWQNLSTEPLPNATRTIRHHADIAFAQLEAIAAHMNNVDAVLVAVPDHYERDQLGLLLGMAQEAGLKIRGLVSAGLLVVANQETLPTSLHLDVSLHQITLSSFHSDGVIRKVEHRVISETGLFTLWDRWANIIARQFIQTNRYDPMHDATSEQRLFDQLPGWLVETKDQSNRTFELDLKDTHHSTTITTDQLVSACSNLYPQMVQSIRAMAPNGATLFVSHRFLGFPGLDESLRLMPNMVVTHLPDAAIVESAAQHWHQLVSGDGQVAHTTQLAVSKVKQQDASNHLQPTHLLVGFEAKALPAALKIASIGTADIIEATGVPALTLLKRDRQLVAIPGPGADILLNQSELDSEASLNAGDVISINGQSLQLISVT